MSILGVSAAHAMAGYLAGKSGKEIRESQKRTFGVFGNNVHANGWASMADRDNRRGGQKADDEGRDR